MLTNEEIEKRAREIKESWEKYPIAMEEIQREDQSFPLLGAFMGCVALLVIICGGGGIFLLLLHFFG